jgi:hypothetical protein
LDNTSREVLLECAAVSASIHKCRSSLSRVRRYDSLASCSGA